MLEQICNRFRRHRLQNVPLLLLAAGGLASCATKEQPQLFSDTKKESNLPWNKQEHWENEGQLGQLAERNEPNANRR